LATLFFAGAEDFDFSFRNAASRSTSRADITTEIDGYSFEFVKMTRRIYGKGTVRKE
jgi:hypothetical protein